MNDHQRERFADLILPHLTDAYGLARALTGNRADAEDVVQDACVRAFRAIENVADASARAWLLTIVHHTAYTWLRKNRSAALVMVDDLELVERSQATAIHDGVETPESLLIANANRIQLEKAIAALPTVFRETLVLRDLQGLGYSDIAKVTGVAVGTVMSRLARARSRVASAIGKDA